MKAYAAPLAAASGRTDAMDLVWQSACVALAYYLTARLGLLIPYVGTHISLIWLPTGVALAAYLRWGSWMAPAVATAAFLVNHGLGGPLWAAAGIAAGNALGPWLATRLLHRLDFDLALTRRQDLGAYLAAVMLGMLVTASNGVLWLELSGLMPPGQGLAAWTTWWIGDAVGALLGGIPLLSTTPGNARLAFGGRRGALNLVLTLVVLGCGLLSFSPWSSPSPVLLFPLVALPLFLIALLALRAGVMAASFAVLLLSMTAAWGTANDIGPFAGQDSHTGLLALWSYLTAQACTTILLCGLTAELLASRRQQHALFTHAREGILVLEPDGLLDTLNPAARAMLGLGAQEPARRPLAELPQGNGRTLACWWAQALSSGGLHAPEYLRLLRADGNALEVEAQIALHTDARGRQLTQLILRDVTERRDAEARLAASEERLRAITDNAPALMAELDSDLRFRFANQTYQHWLGLEPASMLGRTVAEVMGDTTYAQARPHLEAALRGQTEHYERRIASAQGERWLRVSLVPRRCTSGRIQGLYAVASDFTAYRQAVQALRQSEQRLRSVTDHLPMRVSYIDQHERYRFVNRAYEQSFGRPRAHLHGLTIREVVGEGAYRKAQPHIQRALRGEAQAFDSEITTREGYRCYRATYVPQFSDNGQSVLGFVAIVTDTTAQKLEERRLIELTQIDPLTGLLNRAGFDQRCLEAVGRSRGTASPMALLFLDVDGFKQVNDRHGHLAGDMLLRAFAGRLARTLRGNDVVARQGGDEFMVIVENLAGPQDAQTIASKIIDAMQEPFVLEQNALTITTSVGLTLYDGQSPTTPRELIKQADDMLYQAKAEGRNRYCVAEAPTV